MIRPSILLFVVLLPALLAAEIAFADDDLDAEMAEMYKKFPNFKASGGSNSNGNSGGVRIDSSGESRQSTSSQPEMSAIDRTRQEAARRAEEKKRRREEQARRDEEEIDRLKQQVANSRNNIQKGLATFAFLAKVDEMKGKRLREEQEDRADDEKRRNEEAAQRKDQARQAQERQEQARQQQESPTPVEKKGCGDGYTALAFTGECQLTGQVLKFGKSKEEMQQEQARLEQERLERERPERERLERIQQEADEKQRIEDEWIKMSSSSYLQSFQGSQAQGQNTGLSQPSPAQQALDNEVDVKAPCGWRCMLNLAKNAVTQPIKDVVGAVRSVGSVLSDGVKCPDPGAHPTLDQKLEHNNCTANSIAAVFWNPFMHIDLISEHGDVVGRDFVQERK